MKVAAAYIRVSTDDQIEYSPESQVEMIKRYATNNDYILPAEYIFVDEGISGRTVNKRPQFMKMIGTAKTKPKPFDAILLWKFSRFARNREDSIVYKSMLRKQLGIDVISVSENVGDDKMSILFEAMIEAMDEYYSINLSEEVKRGMTERASRGEPCSIPPFGYKMENKQLILNENEASVIKQTFEWYNSGESMLSIAKRLNLMGVRTHRGNLIENRTIEYWLNNPAYIGKIRWTPTGKTSRDYDNPNSIIADGSHEKIIDQELWDSVQQKMKDTKQKYKKWYRPRKKISHWLIGIMRCGICGGSIVNCTGYLYCNNRSKGTCPGNGGLPVKLVEDAVLRQLNDLIFSDMHLNFAPKVISKQKNSSEYDFISKQLILAQARLNRIREAYENGIDTLEEYKANKFKINQEIENLNLQLSSLNKDDDETFSVAEQEKSVKQAIENIIPSLRSEETSDIQKNKAAKEIIDSIIKGGKDGKELTIYFRTQD